MFYKNISIATKTFYGKTFKPGDIKDVPGYINDKGFERCAPPKAAPKQPVATPKPASKSDKINKTEDKEESVDG